MAPWTSAVLAALAFAAVPLGAGQAPGPRPRTTPPQAQLRQKLEARLADIVSHLDGVAGYAVLDLTSGERMGLLAGDVFPTASTIKLAILYELFKQVEERRLALDRMLPLDRSKAVPGGALFTLGTPTLSVRDYAVLMITLSDNTATNVLIDLVGMDAVNARMRGLGLKELTLRRHMIDLAAARRGDENVAAPSDFVRLLEAIHTGDGLTAASRDDMLAILKLPKASALRRGLPGGVAAATKSGELEGVRVDAGIVYAGTRPYILCVMTTYLRSDAEGEQAIEAVSRAAYEYFSRLGAGLEYGRRVGQ